ncbi:hypothetical protein SAMN05421788_106237 [Filimonas lacunae]|uniref:Uncharacterized protein n=1 Tax=Filimonas lacunae TaxID=477680 RepID=A0A1N7QQA7_9BACT|nr:hypothetical protein [Filimonas lacunae]SIT25082.1 hypothetical protein SAMN05421788_106237 [Filimonas lacunae]
MKAIFLTTILSIFFSMLLKAQCDVQVNDRDDGTTVRYMRPDRVGYSDRFILAFSMQTNGVQFCVCTLSVFESNSIKLKGNLILKFDNNKSATFEHYTSELTTYNGYPATISIFLADAIDLATIASSNIKIAMVNLADNTFQTVSVKMNSDILKKQYNCLKQ